MLGTGVHEAVEFHYNGLGHEMRSTTEFGYFLDFHREWVMPRGLIPYRTEWRVFDEQLKLAGTIDMLYRNGDGSGFTIVDWKRSKKISKSSPFGKGTDMYTAHLDDCNFNTYSMQLYLYREVLHRRYGMRVTGCFLCVLHPDNKTYKVHECRDMSKEIFNLFAERGEMFI